MEEEDNSIQGLSTLSRRLTMLEKKEKKKNTEEDQLSKLMKKMKEREAEKKMISMKKVLDHFEDDISEYIKDLEINNITEFVLFSIKYIESNIERLCKILSVQNSSEFKQSLCLSLVKHLTGECYTDEMIILSIDLIHKLLYPKDVVEEKKKVGFFNKK